MRAGGRLGQLDLVRPGVQAQPGQRHGDLRGAVTHGDLTGVAPADAHAQPLGSRDPRGGDGEVGDPHRVHAGEVICLLLLVHPDGLLLRPRRHHPELAQVVLEGVGIHDGGVLGVLPLGEGGEVVPAAEQEGGQGHGVGAPLLQGLPVDAHLVDVAAAGRVAGGTGLAGVGVGDVGGQPQLQIRAGGHGPGVVLLPLLLEHLAQLGAGQLRGPEVVGEGQHGDGVGHRDLIRGGGGVAAQARRELVAQTPGVDDGQVRGRAPRALRRVQVHVRDEVAHGRFPVSLVEAALGLGFVRVPAGGHGGGEVGELPAADAIGVLLRVGEHALRLLQDGVRGDGLGVRDLLGVGDQLSPGAAHLVPGVQGEGDGAEVVPVVAGLQDGTLPGSGLATGRQHVLLVGVTGEDDVHGGAGLGDDAVLGIVRAHPLVVFGDDHVGFAVVGVAVAELLGVAVGGGHGIGELHAAQRGGVHQLGRLGGDGADHGDAHAVVGLEDDVRVQHGVPGGGVDDVGAEDREVRVLGDAPGEVRQALVEFVVAGGAGLQTEGVEVVQGRLVVLDGGDEQAGGDVVPRGEEQAVGVCGALLLQGGGQAHPDLRGDAAVEVVDVEQGELGGPGVLDGVGGGRCGQQDEQGGDGGPGPRAQMADGHGFPREDDASDVRNCTQSG